MTAAPFFDLKGRIPELDGLRTLRALCVNSFSFFAAGAPPSVLEGGSFPSSLLCALCALRVLCVKSISFLAAGAPPSVLEGGSSPSSLLCVLCALRGALCVKSFSFFEVPRP